VISRIRGTYLYQGEEGGSWRILCEVTTNEKDPDRFMELVKQLNRVLDEKEARLRQQLAKQQAA
jgi:hypothetical protein